MNKFSLDISFEKFLDENYEKRFYLSRSSVDVANITWSKLDAALFSWPADDGTLILYDGGRISIDDYTEKYLDVAALKTRVVKDIFYNYIEKGATLVLNKLNGHMPEISDMCRQVSKQLGVKCNANGYVAFGGSGSFGRHWDTHDVFAIQVIGKKRWRIYTPTFEKPLAHQNSKKDLHSCPTDPVLEVVLEPGDVLYLPRGWWHEAVPIPGEESFHISVGLFPPKIIDYLLWTAGNKMTNYLEGRHALRSEGGNKQSIAEFVERLQREMLGHDNLSDFFESVNFSQRDQSRFHLGRIFGKKDESISEPGKVSVLSPVSSICKDAVVVNGVRIKLDGKTVQLLTSVLKHYEGENGAEDFVVNGADAETLKLLMRLDVVDVF